MLPPHHIRCTAREEYGGVILLIARFVFSNMLTERELFLYIATNILLSVKIQNCKQSERMDLIHKACKEFGLTFITQKDVNEIISMIEQHKQPIANWLHHVLGNVTNHKSTFVKASEL